MRKRILSVFLTAVMLLTVFPISALAAEASNGYTTDGNGLMQYGLSSENIDIQGYVNGAWRSVTYSNGGFYCAVKIGGAETGTPVYYSSENAQTIDDTLSVRIIPSFISDGKFIKLTYQVTNLTAGAVTFSLGGAADAEIDSDDNAVISPISMEGAQVGFKMLSRNGIQFNFFSRDVIGVTDVDNMWYGYYGYWVGQGSNRCFIPGTEPPHSNEAAYDSALSYSWVNRTIAGNATQNYSIILGVGEAGSEESLVGTFPVTGRVIEPDGGGTKPFLSEATVKLSKNTGTEHQVTSSAIDGRFNFKNVYPGLYNVSVTHGEGANFRTACSSVVVSRSASDLGDIMLRPATGSAGTEFVIEADPGDTNIPSIASSNFDDFAESVASQLRSDPGSGFNESGSLLIQMKISSVNSGSTSAASINDAVTQNSQTLWYLFDASLIQKINQGTPETITDTGSNLIKFSIQIPEEKAGNTFYVYRLHNGSVQQIPLLPNKTAFGEYCELDDSGTVVNFYVCKFSPYALSYRLIPVTDITGVAGTISVNTPTSLGGTVTPSDASTKSITWTISDAGATGATLTNGTLTATGAGICEVQATVKNGLATGSDFTKKFAVNVILPSRGNSNSNDNTFSITVDGNDYYIGKEHKSGVTTTTTVDQTKLTHYIGTASNSSSIIVPVSENSIATAQLVLANIEDMASKDMTLTVKTGNIAYHLDASAIDLAPLKKEYLGVDGKDILFNVTIKESGVAIDGATLVLKPAEFTLTAVYNGKAVSVGTFSSFIDRTIEVTAEQAKKITTAVVVESDGTLRHAPTSVIEKNGKFYAVVHSMTNSIYALIQNDVTFSDASGKWYESAVNEMASRKIISGRSNGLFDGDISITRAEFAAIVVRALGLPASKTSTFTDVPADGWYSGAVGAAYQYGIADGKGEGKFDPSAKISRQEAMAMISRAAEVAGYVGRISAPAGFTDTEKAAVWALESISFNTANNLIVGSGGKLRPTDHISRAETATVVLRLLQKSGLVDARSKV